MIGGLLLRGLGFALPYLKGFRGALITAGVMGLAGGVVIWMQASQIKQAREDLAAANESLGKVKTELVVIRENRDNLARAIERQSLHVQKLKSAAEAAAERADQAAAAVLNSEKDYVESDRAAGDSPEDMNKWLRDLFSY